MLFFSSTYLYCKMNLPFLMLMPCSINRNRENFNSKYQWYVRFIIKALHWWEASHIIILIDCVDELTISNAHAMLYQSFWWTYHFLRSCHALSIVWMNLPFLKLMPCSINRLDELTISYAYAMLYQSFWWTYHFLDHAMLYQSFGWTYHFLSSCHALSIVLMNLPFLTLMPCSINHYRENSKYQWHARFIIKALN